jgi:CRISPR-associated protein Csm1
MSQHAQMDATTRVALAAYLHDLGKLAERAAAFAGDPRLDANLHLYSPYHEEGAGWYSHRHAAHTALAIDALEPHLPSILEGDVSPFIGRQRAGAAQAAVDATDSFINASAAHHKPNTFLQWIIATADRVASGFEREEFETYNRGKDQTRTGRNHFQARLLTLFEQLNLKEGDAEAQTLQMRYPLRLLSPQSIFPAPASACEPQADAPAKEEYLALWTWFISAVQTIPATHRATLPLWFDHFDSLWLTCSHAIPSATAFGIKPEVSLYDHSRTTAALAASLWRWHEASGQTGAEAIAALQSGSDFNVQKVLLIQGDFFGIQDFIFATGGQLRKQAAKLLRGRSMQVSLFSETAALRILDALGLPHTCQVVNAAGKFLIVAPNTPDVINTLESIQRELNDWFEAHAFGMAGLGLAWEPAACHDFLRRHGERHESTPFSQLMIRLHRSLETAKYRRFDLASRGARVFDAQFPHGPCRWNGRLPADRVEGELASCALTRDQIAIGEAFSKGLDRLLVLHEVAQQDLHSSPNVRTLELPLFGYTLAFTKSQDVSGHFGALAQSQKLRRCWDYAPPSEHDLEGQQPCFEGYARRFIGGYVPRVKAHDLQLSKRYTLPDGEVVCAVSELKTLDMLACEDRVLDEHDEWRGVAALGVLKGDIDDLGKIFQAGLRQPTFAKYAALSRQVHGFFAIYLPWLLAREFDSVYTVFAGGDDFLLIGPWKTIQSLAHRLRTDFARYVAGHEDVHFSAGIATLKPGMPIQSMAEQAEQALDEAKKFQGKNAVTCFEQTVAWPQWRLLESATHRLAELRTDLGLSTGYVYALLQFIDMQEAYTRGDVEASMWRARLAYQTRRMLQRKKRNGPEDELQRWQAILMKDLAVDGIQTLKGAFRIPLFNHLYQYRER